MISAIVLFIVFVLLLSALIFTYKKVFEYYDKMCVFQTRLKLEENKNRIDKAQRDLLVELTDSIQVLMSDITDEDQSTDAAIANFKKDIDGICAKTPRLFSSREDLTPSKNVIEQTCNRDKQGKNRNTYRKNPFTFINVCLILTILVNLFAFLLKLIR